LLVEQLADLVGPGEGQGEQAHQLGQALGVGEVGVLEVEAPGLQSAEQGFDLPAAGIGVDGPGLGGAGAGDEQEAAVLQAQRGEADEAAPDRAAARQAAAFAGLERAEQRVQAQHPVPRVEQGQQELGEEGDPRPVPGQVFGKDGFEFVSRVFREVGHLAKKSG
jgi:hypothetical protein